MNNKAKQLLTTYLTQDVTRVLLAYQGVIKASILTIVFLSGGALVMSAAGMEWGTPACGGLFGMILMVLPTMWGMALDNHKEEEQE